MQNRMRVFLLVGLEDPVHVLVYIVRPLDLQRSESV